MDEEEEQPTFGTPLDLSGIELPPWSLADAVKILEQRHGSLPRMEGTINFAAGTFEIHYVSAEDEARALMMEMDREMQARAEGVGDDEED